MQYVAIIYSTNAGSSIIAIDTCVYLCTQNNEIIHYAKLIGQLSFKIRFPEGRQNTWSIWLIHDTKHHHARTTSCKA